MELKCSIQNYSWGKLGLNSIVAALIKSSNPEFVPSETVPYAELWMGTHPNGPSFLISQNLSLDEYIKQNKYVLGTKIENMYGEQLPFLFKVLSIRKALSIQVHPNKEEAKKLHQALPEIYKDSNHKPELAIALTPFEALCGFRPIFEIINFFNSIPELQTIVGQNKIAELNCKCEIKLQQALKNCFESLMTQIPQIITQQSNKFIQRLSTLDQINRKLLHANLFERLYTDYPGDVGCFSIYLFNYVMLQPGEAIYLGANEPHAYIFGDCIECMACSDNVIRAGLTPKMKDIRTLMNIISYICEPAATKKIKALRIDECTEIFQPPIQDFAVARITITSEILSYNIKPRNTASILIVISGNGKIFHSQILKQGSVLFIPANESFSIKVLCNSNPMLMFQAFANIYK